LIRVRRLGGLAIALPVVLGAARAPVVRAQALRVEPAYALDSRVVQVVSGGAWTDGPRSGQYRIVVRSDGADSVHYTTVVQWMVRRGMSQDLEMVASVDLSTISAAWFSMLDPELRLRNGRWFLVVDAATAPLRTASHRPQFALGPPGQIRAR